MRQSKEQLFQEISELKQTNQVLEELNTKLRTRLESVHQISG
jgi:cell division protein FtsB